ncbi:hypothetical protein K0U00_48875, partial [Paenibacillus sepulcri]|nr:hypothetical protein [Paenibacillus sepulcri]
AAGPRCRRRNKFCILLVPIAQCPGLEWTSTGQQAKRIRRIGSINWENQKKAKLQDRTSGNEGGY